MVGGSKEALLLVVVVGGLSSKLQVGRLDLPEEGALFHPWCDCPRLLLCCELEAPGCPPIAFPPHVHFVLCRGCPLSCPFLFFRFDLGAQRSRKPQCAHRLLHALQSTPGAFPFPTGIGSRHHAGATGPAGPQAPWCCPWHCCSKQSPTEDGQGDWFVCCHVHCPAPAAAACSLLPAAPCVIVLSRRIAVCSVQQQQTATRCRCASGFARRCVKEFMPCTQQPDTAARRQAHMPITQQAYSTTSLAA